MEHLATGSLSSDVKIQNYLQGQYAGLVPPERPHNTNCNWFLESQILLKLFWNLTLFFFFFNRVFTNYWEKNNLKNAQTPKWYLLKNKKRKQNTVNIIVILYRKILFCFCKINFTTPYITFKVVICILLSIATVRMKGLEDGVQYASSIFYN